MKAVVVETVLHKLIAVLQRIEAAMQREATDEGKWKELERLWPTILATIASTEHQFCEWELRKAWLASMRVLVEDLDKSIHDRPPPIDLAEAVRQSKLKLTVVK